MRIQNDKGFTVSEFLITSLSLFSGLYLIFWTCFLGSSYALAQTYLNDYAYCDLDANTRHCWTIMKRKLGSLRFIETKKLFIGTDQRQKTINLIYDFSLPIVGSGNGVKNIQITSSLDKEKWQ